MTRGQGSYGSLVFASLLFTKPGGTASAGVRQLAKKERGLW